MLWRNLLILTVLLSVLFMGCNETQKLSDEELKQKAKECLYSIEEVTFESFNHYKIKADDLYVGDGESMHSSNYEGWDTMCTICGISENSKGLCREDFEKCKSFNGNINIYNFHIKEEIDLPKEIFLDAQAILKDNGEPIGCYITGLIAHYEGSEEV